MRQKLIILAFLFTLLGACSVPKNAPYVEPTISQQTPEIENCIKIAQSVEP